MSDENMTLEEANKIKFREINLEELRASIPGVHEQMDRLQEVIDQSASIRLRYRVY